MKAPSRIRQTLLYLTCQSYMKGSDETWFVYTCQHVWSKPIINNWAIIINKTGRTCPNVFFFSTIINNWAIIINKTGCTCPNVFFFQHCRTRDYLPKLRSEKRGNVLLGSLGTVLDPVEGLSSGAGQKNTRRLKRRWWRPQCLQASLRLTSTVVMVLLLYEQTIF